MIQDIHDSILIKSEDCTQQLEEWKKMHEKVLNQLLLCVGLFGLIILFGPYIIAFLEDKKISQVDGYPPLVYVVLGIAIVLVTVFVYKEIAKVRSEYMVYKQFCAVEFLAADSNKIYGATTKGSYSLNYNQINSVRYVPGARSDMRTPRYPNDILVVKDIAGNEFKFYSFRNCKDIKAVIDMRIGRT